jgi:hypothetical protein
MLEQVIGLVCAVTFISKVILQVILDGLASNEKGRDGNDYYRIKYFLPYYSPVPQNYLRLRKLCNFLYYLFVFSVCLFLIIWNFN